LRPSFQRDAGNDDDDAWVSLSTEWVTPGLARAQDLLQGNDVLDVAIGASDSAYRTVKVPMETFDADILRVTAGHS